MNKRTTLLYLFFLHFSLNTNVGFAEETTGDIAKLVYAWYPGISAEVKYKHDEDTEISGQKSNKTEIDGSFLLRTSKHEKGIQIDFNEIYLNFGGGKDPKGNDKMQAFMQELIGISPAYVIDSTGGLIEVTKFDEFQETIKSETLKFFNDVPKEELAKVQQFVNSIFSKEQLMLQLHEDWNRDVGQWVGAELEQGYNYDIEFTQKIPMLGNIEVPNKGTYEFLGRVNCNKKDQQNSCVKLSYTSFVDQEATKPMMEKLFSSLGVENTENIGIDVDYKVEVVTEESTLLPHYVRETKKATTPNPQNGQLIIKNEVSEYIYTYLKK